MPSGISEPLDLEVGSSPGKGKKRSTSGGRLEQRETHPIMFGWSTTSLTTSFQQAHSFCHDLAEVLGGKQSVHSQQRPNRLPTATNLDLATELCKETLTKKKGKNLQKHAFGSNACIALTGEFLFTNLVGMKGEQHQITQQEISTRASDNLNGWTVHTDSDHDSLKTRNLPVKRAYGSVE